MSMQEIEAHIFHLKNHHKKIKESYLKEFIVLQRQQQITTNLTFKIKQQYFILKILLTFGTINGRNFINEWHIVVKIM